MKFGLIVDAYSTGARLAGRFQAEPGGAPAHRHRRLPEAAWAAFERAGDNVDKLEEGAAVHAGTGQGGDRRYNPGPAQEAAGGHGRCCGHGREREGLPAMSVLTVRPMQAGDLAFAASLTLGEQWHSETLEEFEGFFSRDPAGCLVAEQGGRRVGIGVATSYGDTGFLGQIVVHPEWRGQGIGDRMVGALLSRLRSVGVRSVYLDGTSAGVPLYERHGFRKVQPSLRYAGEVRGLPHPQVRPMRAGDLAAVCDLDREWWGEDRSFFLERRWRLHGGLCHVLEQDGAVRGYVLARRRGEKLWVGPWCAAADVDAPEALLLALAEPGTAVQVHAGALASSVRAQRAFERLGLQLADNPPWRMVCGPDTALGQSVEVLANGTSAKG